MSARVEPPARLDLRLLAPATAAWAGAAWAPSAAPVAALVVAGAAGLLALAVGGQVRRSARRGRPARGALVAAGALVCLAAGVLAAGLRAQAREAGPLPALADRRAAVTVDLVVTDDPRALRPRPGAGRAGRDERVVVPARLEALTAAGVTTGLRAPVVVLAPSQGWSGLLPSQRVRVAARLGPAREGDSVTATVSVRDPPAAVTDPSTAHRVAGTLRAGLRAAVEPLPAREQGLLPGLVVGDVSRLDPGLREDFRRTGMAHLVAVSGSNVAIVLAAALLAARLLHAGPRTAPAAAGLALAGFVVLARPSPSVLRAGVTGAIGVAALAAGRHRSALPALLAAVLVLVLVEPALARAPGFALSVSATAGLLLLGPPLRDVLARRLPRPLAEALAVAVAAQVAVSPVVAALSAEVSLVAVPANLLAVPAVPPATVLGVLAALLAPVSLPLAQLVARVAGVPTSWLVTVAERGAQVPVGAVPWPAGARGGLLLAGVTVAVGVALTSRPARRLVAAAAAGGLAAVVVLAPVSRGGAPPGWALAFCDVGQGDAVVLAAAPGAAVLVDAGPDPDAVDRCLRDLGVRSVPRVVLTHLHADHVDGLPGVLRGRDVGVVEVVPLPEPAGALAGVQRTAAAAGVPLETSTTGEVRTLGALRWEVVGPVRQFRGSSDDPNNNSIVLRVELPGLTALLTGDVEPEAQAALLAAGVDLRADVLKVPHHGSRHQDPAFLRAIGARVAVASAGQGNTYGHPAPETLDLLAADGAHVYRTDTHGTVVVAVQKGGIVTRPSVPRTGRRARPARPQPGPPPGADVSPTGTGGPSLRQRSRSRIRPGAPGGSGHPPRGRAPSSRPLDAELRSSRWPRRGRSWHPPSPAAPIRRAAVLARRAAGRETGGRGGRSPPSAPAGRPTEREEEAAGENDGLDRGRDAFRRRVWDLAYRELSAADRACGLDPDDVVRLATAAHLSGRDLQSARLWARAYRDCLRAGDVPRAARCALWLGVGLLLRGELAHGGGWLARAGRLLDDDRLDCVERGYLLVPAALRQIGGGDPEGAYASATGAAEVGVRFRDPDLLTLARLLQGQALLELGRPSPGVALLDEAMVAVTAGEVSPLVTGLVYCAVIESCQEILDVRRAQEWTSALARWCDAQPQLVPYRGQCLVHRAELLRLGGSWADAMQEAQRAYELLSRPPGQPAAGAAAYQRAELHRLRGEHPEAEDAYREASRWGRDPQPGLALLRLAQGRLDAALAGVRRAVAETPHRPARAVLLGAWVEVALCADDLAAAREAAGELSAAAVELGAPLLHAVADRARGTVLLADGDLLAACEVLRRARETWQELAAPYEEARTRLLLGQAGLAIRDRDVAVLELDAARRVFARLGAAPDLARVDGLLASTPGRSGRVLSARETQVLSLLATGQTNREIAAALVLSEHTVRRHVQNIFAKLDVSSRAAATAAAFRRRLL